MAPLAPSTIHDLGLPGALYMAALLQTRSRRVRVAPTRRMTLALMSQLKDLELIEVPWPAPRWDVAPDAWETPIEALQWRLRWTAYVPDLLGEALRDFLRTMPRDEYAVAVRLRLWRDLALAEAERFFEIQLIKHRLDGSWSQDLVFVHKEARVELSAAQWRYCCWAATRHGAAFAQRLRVPDAGAVYAELRRRIGPVATGQWGNTAFVPFNPLPESALSQLFVSELAPLDQAFWSAVPSDLALLSVCSR